MFVYFDESGDLGWKFDKPYRQEGSSRFLTIAHIFTTRSNEKYINRHVRDIYTSKGRPFKLELKAAGLEDYDRINIAKETVKLIQNGKVEIHAVTVAMRRLVFASIIALVLVLLLASRAL